MKLNSILIFAAGLTLGALGGHFATPQNKDTGPSPEIEQKIVTLERQVADSQRREAALKIASEKTTEAALAISSVEQEEAMKEMEENMKRMQEKFKERLAAKNKTKVDEKLALYKSRLGLTDAQVETLRPAIEKSVEGNDLSQMMMGVMSDSAEDGKSAEEREKEMLSKMLHPVDNEALLHAAMLAELSPEQKTAYEELKHEQFENKVEIATNKELSRLQSSMTLSNEQKDAAFAALSQLSHEEMANPIRGFLRFGVLQPDGMDHLGEEFTSEIKQMNEELDTRKQRRIEAMAGILTPEQQAVYVAQQNDPGTAMQDLMAEMGDGLMMGWDIEASQTEDNQDSSGDQ